MARSVIVSLCLMALASPVHAQNPPTVITGYKGKVLRIYGPDCRWVEDMPVSKLPKPAPLLPASPNCDRPSIDVKGRRIWLAADEITTNSAAIACVRQARPAGQNAALAGDVGSEAGSAPSGNSCTLG